MSLLLCSVLQDDSVEMLDVVYEICFLPATQLMGPRPQMTGSPENPSIAHPGAVTVQIPVGLHVHVGPFGRSRLVRQELRQWSADTEVSARPLFQHRSFMVAVLQLVQHDGG